MYRCKHFILQELVPPEIYAERGESAWKLLDDRILISADQVREQFGPIFINTWHDKKLQSACGQVRKYSGLRPFISDDPDCPTTKWSDHRYGRALDAISLTVKAEDMRKFIIKNKDKFPYITALEVDISWLHFACRNIDAIELIPKNV